MYQDTEVTSNSDVVTYHSSSIQYRFKVRAYNSDGWSKKWSAYKTFSTVTKPATPAGLSASNNLLSWNASNGATKYQVLVQRKQGRKWRKYKQLTITKASYLVPPYTSNVAARFKVQAGNVAGWSAWSKNKTFTLQKTDVTPDDFGFDSLVDQPVKTEVISNAAQITGINTPVPISVYEGGLFQVSDDGVTWTEVWLDHTEASTNINNNQYVRVKHTTSSEGETKVQTMLTVSGISKIFESTTKIQKVITITSTVLKKCIKNRYGEITQEKLSKLKYLECPVSGGGAFEQTDIEELAQITTMEWLEFYAGEKAGITKINDFSPLNELANLTGLKIRNGKGNLFSHIPDLDNLSSIVLDQMLLTDTSGLGELKGLKEVVFNRSWPDADLSGFEQVERLETLSISTGSGARALSSLNGLSRSNHPELQYIDINAYHASSEEKTLDVKALQSFESLIDLYLLGHIESLEGLENLSEIHNLEIYNLNSWWRYEMPDLASIKNLNVLDTLSLAGDMSDISPLSTVSIFNSLVLSNNHPTYVNSGGHIIDISPLKHLASDVGFYIQSDNCVHDVSMLQIAAEDIRGMNPQKPISRCGGVPDAFEFVDAEGVPLQTQVESNVIEVQGIGDDNFSSPIRTSISVENGEYSVQRVDETAWSNWSSEPSGVYLGDKVRVRHTSSQIAGEGVVTVLTIGGMASEFKSKTTGPNMPPVISGLQEKYYAQGLEELEIKAVVTDPESDFLSIKWRFSGDSALLIFKPKNNKVSIKTPPDIGLTKTFEIRLLASDGLNEVVKEIILIQSTSSPPLVQSESEADENDEDNIPDSDINFSIDAVNSRKVLELSKNSFVIKMTSATGAKFVFDDEFLDISLFMKGVEAQSVKKMFDFDDVEQSLRLKQKYKAEFFGLLRKGEGLAMILVSGSDSYGNDISVSLNFVVGMGSIQGKLVNQEGKDIAQKFAGERIELRGNNLSFTYITTVTPDGSILFEDLPVDSYVLDFEANGGSSFASGTANITPESLEENVSMEVYTLNLDATKSSNMNCVLWDWER